MSSAATISPCLILFEEEKQKENKNYGCDSTILVKDIIMKFEGFIEIICRQKILMPREGRCFIQVHSKRWGGRAKLRHEPGFELLVLFSFHYSPSVYNHRVSVLFHFYWTHLSSQTSKRAKMIQEILIHFQRQFAVCRPCYMACSSQ